jgi:selenocysteine lyase/cysteine desulfurase
VIALDFLRKDNGEVADALEQKYGILTRCGLHCAPSAHKTLGTFPQGVVRFSMGYRTTKEEVLEALLAIEALR